jgi:transposase
MTRKRRSFSPEFKQEAAYLVLDQGYSTAEAGRSLNVGENALRRWVKQVPDSRLGSV